ASNRSPCEGSSNLAPCSQDWEKEKKRARRPARKIAEGEEGGSVRQCGGPVGLDLAHQRIGQGHVAQRARLVVAIGVDPTEELARILRAFRILWLLAHQDEVGGGDR